MTDRVEINAAIMQGKPVIRGTRIPVELLVRKLAEGATIEDLLDAYPRLVIDDIRAALAYAADTIVSDWKNFAGFVETGNPRSSQSVDEIVYGHKD